MKTIKSVIRSLQRSPLKSFLTLFTVGLGVGVLIFALGLTETFSVKVRRELESSGLILYIANATYSDDDGLKRVLPPEFSETVLTVLRQEVSGVGSVTPVMRPFWNEFMVSDKVYKVRTVVSSDAGYAGVTGMQFVAGDFLSEEDVEKAKKVAAISESLAQILFGSPGEALGKTLKPPVPEFMRVNMRQDNGNNNSEGERRGRRLRTNSIYLPTFTITGVFEDFSELKRTSYGLGDMVIPYTSNISGNQNSQLFRRYMMSTLAINVQGGDFARVEAQVRDVLSREYGEDVQVLIWEGTPDGEANVLQETRQSIGTFALVVNLLGFLLLITGSIGILSIMLVEVLGKTRDIALERSLGASRRIIIKEYFIRSLVLTSTSVVFGIVLSLVFSEPLKQIILPIFYTLGDSVTSGSVITPLAVFIGGASSLLIGGVFGILPLLSALQVNISEGLREV